MGEVVIDLDKALNQSADPIEQCKQSGKMLVSHGELAERQAWSLEEKIAWSVQKILAFYLTMKGRCHVSFSGGKDSQVVMEIIRRMWDGRYKKYFAEIPFEHGLTADNCLKYGPIIGVFADTGLEKIEIRRKVEEYGDSVVWVRPKKRFPQVIEEEGIAFPSKKVARMIREIQNPHPGNAATRNLYLTGIKQDGTTSRNFKLPACHRHLIDAPFKVSEKCCDYFKKEPFKTYEKQAKSRPITGTTAAESNQRRAAYMVTGCNSFTKGKEMSRPLSVWLDADVWAYAAQEGIRFADCYYDKVYEYQGQEVLVRGSKREGCMFCLFGVDQEEKQKKRGQLEMNRFEKMAITHPRTHKYMLNKLGFREKLEYLGISHTPTIEAEGETVSMGPLFDFAKTNGEK